MNQQTSYKKQSRLSLYQFLAELPNFVVMLASLIISRSLIVLVDLMDSLGYTLRTGMVALLSKKLSRNLKYEYNFGVGKIEALSALMCDGIVLLGLISTLGLSIFEIIQPAKPSDLLIVVVGIKVISVSLDTYFFVGQRKIMKQHSSAISKSNYAAAFAALLFDSVTLLSLLIIWLLRDNPISGYITPVVSIIIAAYLIVGCIKRIKSALNDITDKTLDEKIQLKILKVMAKFYDSYNQFYAVKSRKNGELMQVELHISFKQDTCFEQILQFKQQIQQQMTQEIGSCTVDIVLQDDSTEIQVDT